MRLNHAFSKAMLSSLLKGRSCRFEDLESDVLAVEPVDKGSSMGMRDE